MSKKPLNDSVLPTPLEFKLQGQPEKKPQTRGGRFPPCWVLLPAALLAWTWTAVVASRLDAQDSYPAVVQRLALSDCIAIALRNQPAIQIRQAEISVAEEQVNIASSHFFPQVNFTTRYTLLDEARTVDVPSPLTGPLGDLVTDAGAFFGIARQAGSAAANAALDNPNLPPFSTAKQAAQSSLPGEIRTDLLGENFITTQLQLVQPLWTGGKIRYRNQQAKLGTHAAVADRIKSEQETVFHVTHAYLAIQLAGELMQVADDTVGHFQAIESLAQSLLNEGDDYVTTADPSRARSLRLLAEEERVRVRRAADQAYVALRQAMGLPGGGSFRIADEPLVPAKTELALQDLLNTAFRMRPEMVKAGIGIDVADLEAKLADSEFHPNVAFFGRFSTIHDDRSFANPNDPQEWATGVAVDLPLVAGGRRLAQRRQADSLRHKARQVHQWLLQSVTSEVEQAYLEYVEMSERLPFAEAAVRDAEATILAYDEQLLADFIADEDMPEYIEDLLTARLLLTQAAVRYNQNKFAYDLALAKIKRVTGSHEYQADLHPSSPRPGVAATLGLWPKQRPR